MKVEIPSVFNISESEIVKIIKYYNSHKTPIMSPLYKLDKSYNINGKMGGFYIPAYSENNMRILFNKAEYYLSIYDNNEKISEMKNKELIDLYNAYIMIQSNKHIRYIYWCIENHKVYLNNDDKHTQFKNNEINILESYFQNLNKTYFDTLKEYLSNNPFKKIYI
jgi:hypothetical protein